MLSAARERTGSVARSMVSNAVAVKASRVVMSAPKVCLAQPLTLFLATFFILWLGSRYGSRFIWS